MFEQQKKSKKDEQTQKRLLTLNEAAEYLSISYWTMREYALNGYLPSVKLPCPSGNRKELRRTLIDRKDLDAFVERYRILIPT
jgi:excisionase family DNA binding protein